MTRYELTKYESLTAIVDSIKPEYHSRNDGAWSGGSCEQAIKLAKYGWPEGVRDASELAQSIAQKAIAGTSHGMVHNIGYEVAGAAYDAGAIALGLPEAWGIVQPEETKRAIWLVVNMAASGGVSSDRLMTRGIAIGALVMTLQASGYPVTVDVLQLGTEWDKSEGSRIDLSVRVQDASSGSPLDLDRLIFATCHTAMFRNVMRYAADSKHGAESWGPQTPCDKLPEAFGKPDLYIGGAHLDQSARWTDGGAAWVLEEYERQTQPLVI